jgi:hypothetical protein
MRTAFGELVADAGRCAGHQGQRSGIAFHWDSSMM